MSSPQPSPQQPDAPSADPVAYVTGQGGLLLDEAAALRADDWLPPHHADPPAWSRVLRTEARPRLDRMEAILIQAMVLRTTIKAGSRNARNAQSEAWDAAWDRISRTGARSGNDFETGRERQARIDLQVIGQTRTMRSWENAYDIADNVCGQIRELHRGMAEVRQDILAHLRNAAWESHLEH